MPPRLAPRRGRALAAVTLSAALAVLGLTAAAPSNAAAGLTAQGVRPDLTTTQFELANDADGLCLDADGSGPTAGQTGDKVQLWTCSGAANQHWIGLEIPDTVGTAWVLTAPSGQLGDGDQMIIRPPHAGDNQEWR